VALRADDERSDAEFRARQQLARGARLHSMVETLFQLFGQKPTHAGIVRKHEQSVCRRCRQPLLKPLVKLPHRIAAAPSFPDGDVEEIVEIR
jgi:hypothetical protein